MDFSLTSEQMQIQHSLDRALASLCPLPRIRRHAGEPESLADDVWRGMVALGVPGLVVSEAHGGLGLGVLEAALLAQVLGKHAAPIPFLGAVVLAPLAIAACGSDAQQRDCLPRIASGELRIGVGISEFAGGARSGAKLSSHKGRLQGTSMFVLDAVGAHRFLVVDRDGGFHLVDRDAPGLAIVPLDTVDCTRSTAKLVFDDVAAEPLGQANASCLRHFTDAARVVLAADMLGAAWKMLDQAVEYAKLRKQFGRPIGTFQAIKHLCAEMAAELEPGRALMWYAAYAANHRLSDASVCCAHAKAYVAEAARSIARSAIEVHGGIGITDELGLHFWFKRIAWGYQALGTPERLREEASRLQALI